MRKIIHGIEFSRREHYDCTQWALQVVLQFYGYKLEDILLDEWRFIYRRGDAEGVQISSGHLDMRQKFLDYGIPLVAKRATDAKEAWSAMKHLVDKGKPIPVLVDVYHLEYYSFKNAHHAPHYVILDGYDEKLRTVHITDPSPSELFKGDIPLEDFESALSSSYFHHNWIEFEFPSHHVGHNPDILWAKIRENVNAMLERGRGTDIFWGIEGIRAFARDVKEWASIHKEVLIDNMKTCFDDLTKVSERLDGHYHFLASASEILESPDLKEISFEVGKLAQRWFLLRNMFFKGSKKEPFAMLPRIHHKLLDIADREEQVLIALREVVRT
jgi:hypothetical protein